VLDRPIHGLIFHTKHVGGRAPGDSRYPVSHPNRNRYRQVPAEGAGHAAYIGYDQDVP
jgi:hypothetical protein